jgi:sterol desaturase/sphingolipid hydroxylase (fatty acid hydroxylase superfamily)
MPSPLELVFNPVSYTVFAIYAGLIVWEAAAPARSLPRVPGWRTRGIAAFAVYFFLSSYLPFFWTDVLAEWQLFDLTAVGTAAGAAIGLLVYEAGVYVWHRSMHVSNRLWRAFHQMHHSAERIDTFGAFWFSPLDMIGWTALSSVCLTTIVGVSPESAVIVLYVTTFLSVFQHANVRTPHWLGYVVQRPESHSYHHERGAHARNYSDLPVFDWLLGTFTNPEGFARAAGFYDGASARVVEMLTMRDVSTHPAQPDDDGGQCRTRRVRDEIPARVEVAADVGLRHEQRGRKLDHLV